MEQFLDNKYAYWIITFIATTLFGIISGLLKKQQAAQEKRMDKIESDSARDHERLSEVMQQLPIQYTLRDEFLRVTTDQNRKLDKIGDTLGELSQGMAAIKAAVTDRRE